MQEVLGVRYEIPSRQHTHQITKASPLLRVIRPFVHNWGGWIRTTDLLITGEALQLRNHDNVYARGVRRARGIEVWAALRNLGRPGVANAAERVTLLWQRFVKPLSRAGAEVSMM